MPPHTACLCPRNVCHHHLRGGWLFFIALKASWHLEQTYIPNLKGPFRGIFEGRGLPCFSWNNQTNRHIFLQRLDKKSIIDKKPLARLLGDDAWQGGASAGLVGGASVGLVGGVFAGLVGDAPRQGASMSFRCMRISSDCCSSSSMNSISTRSSGITDSQTDLLHLRNLGHEPWVRVMLQVAVVGFVAAAAATIVVV